MLFFFYGSFLVTAVSKDVSSMMFDSVACIQEHMPGVMLRWFRVRLLVPDAQCEST